MAADGVNKLSLILIHGQQKHGVNLELAADESGNVITVERLAREAERLTSVPLKGQRLIFKGKSLTALDAPLSQVGIKDGSKVMLIGKKVDAEDDALVQKLKNLESDVTKNEKKLSDVTHELDGIHRGYVQDDLKADALTKLSKRLASVIEQFMKLLEKVDCLQFGESGSTEGKNLRKNIVNRIQELLKRCDALALGLNEMLTLS